MKNRSRITILHLITGLETGGAEMNLVRLLPALEQHARNIVCCLTGEGPISQLLRKKNIPVIHLGARRSVFNFFSPKILRTFRTLIHTEKPDVMITYLVHADLFGRVWGRIFGVKNIFCSNRGSLLGWQWLSSIDRITSFLVTGYLFQTRAMCNMVAKKQHILSEKTCIIPNAVDLADIDKQETDRSATLQSMPNPSLPTIICVANLRKGKGHVTLLRAHERLSASFGPINLLIVGDGDQCPILEALATQSNARKNVFFLGYRSDIPQLLRASDCFVLPTHYEGMSNAILEAITAGVPVVTTDIPVNREVIRDGISGLLVPIGNEEKLTEAIELILRNPKRSASFVKKGQQFIQDTCRPEKVAKKLFEHIQSKIKTH